MTTYRVCFCFNRRFKPVPGEQPEGMQEVFRRYSENGVMAAEQLQRFLEEVQGEFGVTREQAQAIVDAHGRRGLSLQSFFQFLFSDDNSPIPPPPPSLGVYQDMSAPLSHYFIHTGHNSYLTGNQISSACSDVPIIKALQRGVRVIELDLWPNSNKDDIHVLHGRTLTTPVELIKCLRSIKEHAFTASQYPVIITLEDHLTPHLQAIAAKMITETFGEMLLVPETKHLEEFPSPEELKKRIIISTKPPKEYLESKTMVDKENSMMRIQEEEEAWGPEVTDLKPESLTHTKTDSELSFHLREDEDADDGGDHKSHQPVVHEYKRLIAIAVRKRKGELSDMLKVHQDEVTRLSVSESLFQKAANTHATELVRFTQRNLLRIYPKTSRVTSSNYNPLLGWMHGAQMVALNMQGHGRSLWLMQGMFRANGGCGYVKKPQILLQNDAQVFNPKEILPVKTTLKVRVYMGDGWRFDFSQSHFDTYSPPDFYARVGIAGVEQDTAMKRTKAVEDNWAPIWDEEFVFPLRVPELALLRIEVHEYDMSDKDDFGGQTCLPVWELRRGIRAVGLCDRKGEKYESVKLLMRFDFT